MSGSIGGSKLFATGMAARAAAHDACLGRGFSIVEFMKTNGATAADIVSAGKLALEVCNGGR